MNLLMLGIIRLACCGALVRSRLCLARRDTHWKTREMSLSYSAHMMNVHFQQKAPEEVLADHAVKIYKKENEQHWRRIFRVCDCCDECDLHYSFRSSALSQHRTDLRAF